MTDPSSSPSELWARLRFSVIGPLLSSPPPPGELKGVLEELAARTWHHPTRKGELVRFSLSTIERWYYTARDAKNPIEALGRGIRKDAGTCKKVTEALAERLRLQYRQHPHWTYRLHHDNLAILIEEDPSLGPLPSYPTLRRFLQARGWRRTRRTGNEHRPGLRIARSHLDRREVRSFEVEFPGSLWHLDFHTSRHVGVLGPDGRWIRPALLAIVDDHSRLCCHAQFFHEQGTSELVHGLVQAILRRGVPRGLLTDNGGEMTASEFVQGLERLSIVHETTLPYSPHQNGKQEHFWAVVEGRFLSMLDGIEDLVLLRLNTLLHAWLDGDYNRHVHSETGQTPIDRLLTGRDVTRQSPSPQELRSLFRQHIGRKIRRSDLTVTIEGRRFEIPSAYRHLDRVRVAYARWDLGFVHLLDPRTGKDLVRIFPLDRLRNASGKRRSLEDPPGGGGGEPSGELPPLLRRLLEDYSATGLPPAYLPEPLQDEDPAPDPGDEQEQDDNEEETS